MGVVAGVLLAAGAGRRYGKPKVLVDGWLASAVAALRGGGCDVVLVVLGAAQVPLPDGIIGVTASDWQIGLSASVRAGLTEASAVGAEYAVLHVVDTPDVGAAVVTRVVQRALGSRSGLAQAYYGYRPGHPVVIARRYFDEVMACVAGDRGAGPFLRRRGDVEVVHCEDLASGVDYDEPV
ncbi:nucleotidyltransferase family protein [Mycobacterium asiaticum]|uniref:Molybdopterin-guanine dinucleotide biosynthesis protein MobA n=1 Tax=Mycobacterium asiaticum TaxID=1790 RepID=A0A1A3KRR1_MYCAS|nr:NTP transferase domain-containing protein [Mycobacterium asiaticum]OBJ86641.1 molybdopterin-guanine dinucleotide biosynthesis protein MobA [Mycobacterium asiaticum]